MTGIHDLNCRSLILVCISSDVTSPETIAKKLHEVGMPTSASTVRARLSEMKRDRLVMATNLNVGLQYCLTSLGQVFAAGVTALLSDDQLGQFSPYC